MINRAANYEPTRPIAPGETLTESLTYLKITPEVLAHRTGTSVDYVKGVLNGTVAITPSFAQQLAKVINVSADFWLRYESQYQRLLQKYAKKLTD